MTRTMKSMFTALGLISCIFYTQAQVVTLNPPFVTDNDSVTVTFNAALGNAALIGATTVYAHTGIITSKSTSGTDWRYVQGNWGTDDAKVKMTSQGNNIFTLRYHIRSFYGLPANEQGLKLAFVFRNQNGSTVGRAADGGDIFVDLSQGGFSVLFKDPTGSKVIREQDSISISIATSAASSITLFKNGNSIAQVANDSILNRRFLGSDWGIGNHQLVAKAIHNNDTDYDTVDVVVRPASAPTRPLPSGVIDGINYVNDSTVTLVLYAPGKSYVFVLGDFNNWSFNNDYLMNRTPAGDRYWMTLTRLEPGKEYGFQYIINDEQMRIPDWYADKLLDPWNDGFIPSVTYPNLKPYPGGKTTQIVSVLQTAQTPYNWQHSQNFRRPAAAKLVVYELLVRDFVGRHDYQTLIDTIAYLKRLGINAVQLMPITEFEGNESWGYNISFYFAPDKYYGTKDALKEFIDVCHREGMSVILDMVLNHSFGQSPMVRMYFNPNLGQYGQPTPDNPWFNQTDRHPFGVGYDFNHESLRTQEFVDTVLKYWLHEYKFDGFRFDLSKGFTQKNTGSDVGAWGAYDQSRINIWKRIMQEVRTYDTSAYMILEHFADNSEETVLSNEGFMFWGNINSAYNEATMGYFGSSDLNWANYKARGWSKPNLVAYAESHDEERLMYKNIRFGSSLNPEHNVKDTTIALRRIEAAMCFLIPLKGPKMIWQFGELGYDYSIDFNGRVGNKPIRWDYLNDSRRKRIYEVTSTLNRLKITDDSLSTDNYTFAAGNTAIKTLTINSGTTKATIVGNFGISTAFVTTRFPSNGMWYDVFGNDSVMLTDSTLTDTIAPGGYRVWLNRFVQTKYPTAIQEQSTQIDWSHATVYPNPTQSDFTIVTGIKGLPQLTMQITDITGKVVCSKYYNEAPEAIQMRSSEMGLTTGMYFVNLALPTSKKQFKLIIL